MGKEGSAPCCFAIGHGAGDDLRRQPHYCMAGAGNKPQPTGQLFRAGGDANRYASLLGGSYRAGDMAIGSDPIEVIKSVHEAPRNGVAF